MKVSIDKTPMPNLVTMMPCSLNCKTGGSSVDSNTVDSTIDNKSSAIRHGLRHAVGLSILSLSLAACAPIPPANVAPVVATPNVALDRGYDGQPVATEQERSMGAERWQDYYQDPKLQALIAIGLDNNKDIEQTLLAIRRAEAQYQITDNKDLPTLNANGSYSRGATNAVDKNPDNSYSANLAMANYELDFWGRVASLKEQALHNYLATTAAKDTAQVSLIANIAKSYVALSYQMMQLQLATKTLDSRLESLRITQARLQAGIDPKTPSLRAAVAADDAYIAKLEAARNVEKGINALQYLIGAPIPEALLPTPAIKSITNQETFSAGLPSELLRYRPDILQAEYELKAAGANIEVARAAYYPSISLTGRLGYSSNELGNLFNTSAAGWSFGPSISVPIFDAGQLDANYEMAQIDQEQALLRYERSIETAFKEVSDVLTDKAILDARLAAEYRLQENYKQILDIAEARYQAQVDDYLSVLDAQRSQFATQQRIVSLEQERVMNEIEMYKVLGGGANLSKPVPIPLTQNTNFVNLLVPTSTDEKVLNAIKAASSPEVVTLHEVAIIQASKPSTTIQTEIIDTADINADAKPDVIVAKITEITKTPLIPIDEDAIEFKGDTSADADTSATSISADTVEAQAGIADTPKVQAPDLQTPNAQPPVATPIIEVEDPQPITTAPVKSAPDVHADTQTYGSGTVDDSIVKPVTIMPIDDTAPDSITIEPASSTTTRESSAIAPDGVTR